jgi:hypothetical protein
MIGLLVDYYIKMAIQSFDEWQNTQKTTQTIPQDSALQASKGEGILSKIGSTYNTFSKSPLGTAISYILQAPEYAIAGGLLGTRKKAEELVHQVKSGQMGKLSALFESAKSGVGGIIPGIKNRTTIQDYLQEVEELSPAQKLAVGLPASFAIPAIPIGKISKGIGLTKKIGNLVSKAGEIPIPLGKYGTKLGELFVPRYGQPENYAKLAKETSATIGMGAERGLEIAKPISKLSSETQTMIGRMMRGEIPTTPEMEALTRPAQEEFAKWGQMALEEVEKGGLKLPEEVIQGIKQNLGQYMPRLYKTFEEGKKGIKAIGDFKPVRMDLSRFKNIKDIPEDIRQAMGEITEAGYPTAKGIAQMAQAVTRSKFFRKIGENQEWVSDIAKDGYELLPKTERLGNLSGKYVLAPIAHDVQDWIATKGPIEKLANQVTGWWKYSKVVLNPATHVRNMLSNVVQAYTNAGLSPVRVDIYTDALTDLAKRGTDYQEAKKLGLMSSTYYGNEIKQMLNGVKKGNGIIDFLKGRAKGLGNLYQAEEQWFKLAVFKHQKELGKPAEEAIKVAQDSLFDYSEVPKSIKFLRESVAGVPFLTFAYKAMPKAVQSFMENPTRFANLRRVNQAIEGLSSKEEKEQEVKNFPDWMKDKSKEFLKIPLKDKYGRSQYADLSYIYPWYSYAGVKPGSHPFVSIISDVTKNKDYIGNEIYKETDTEEEKNMKIGKYVFQQIVPSLGGGYGFEKLVKAGEQKPDYMGRTPNIPQTILDTMFGIKVQPFDLQEQKRWRMTEGQNKMEDLNKQLQNLLRSPASSPQDKQKAVLNFTKKRQDILKQLVGE